MPLFTSKTKYLNVTLCWLHKLLSLPCLSLVSPLSIVFYVLHFDVSRPRWGLCLFYIVCEHEYNVLSVQMNFYPSRLCYSRHTQTHVHSLCVFASLKNALSQTILVPSLVKNDICQLQSDHFSFFQNDLTTNRCTVNYLVRRFKICCLESNNSLSRSVVCFLN